MGWDGMAIGLLGVLVCLRDFPVMILFIFNVSSKRCDSDSGGEQDVGCGLITMQT